MSQPVRVDSAVLDQLRALGGDALVERLISLFLESSEGYMEQIGNGIRVGVLVEVETASHTLKSGAGSLGAGDVHRLAEELESLARDSDMDRSREKASELTEVWSETCTELRQVLSS